MPKHLATGSPQICFLCPNLLWTENVTLYPVFSYWNETTTHGSTYFVEIILGLIKHQRKTVNVLFIFITYSSFKHTIQTFLNCLKRSSPTFVGVVLVPRLWTFLKITQMENYKTTIIWSEKCIHSTLFGASKSFHSSRLTTTSKQRRK